MITPTNVKINNCKILDDFSAINSNREDILINNILNGFEESPAYTEVVKNFDETKTYKTWIYEGNAVNKIVPYKTILSYPYDDYMFAIGDFVTFEYGKIKKDTWLIESLDTQHTFDVKGKILQCNRLLKYRKNNQIISVPCVFMDGVTYTNFSNRGTDKVVEPNAEIVIMTQQNSDTAFVQKNRRFIFNDLVYAVKQTVRSLNDNFLKIFLYEVPEQQEDDFVNGVAWNGESIVIPPTTETTLLPQTYEISEDEALTYTIYKYVGGVAGTDTFTFTLSNVPTANYQLTVVDGNTFKIKCLSAYDKNALKVICKNNVTLEEFDYNIWLTGGWI